MPNRTPSPNRTPPTNGTPSPDRTPVALLDRALVADPARPLLTWYDVGGARVELSVATFGNWVAKTANLLTDALGAGPGDRVSLRLPLHWQAAVWLGACWATSTVAVLDGTPAPVAVVDVADPSAPGGADEVVGLGLGPLGLAQQGRPTPAYVTLDYDREVHSHGDRFVGPAQQPDAPALGLAVGTLDAAELVARADAAARAWGITSGDRILSVRPIRDLADVLAVLLVPLARGAASVLCRDPDEAGLPRRAAEERVTAGWGWSRGPVRALGQP
ncbi:MAG: hypothetical protein QOJ60_2768 [Actinomycetota bacterium]|nr:hypothetical protein [Actinomycetota bacterium]